LAVTAGLSLIGAAVSNVPAKTGTDVFLNIQHHDKDQKVKANSQKKEFAKIFAKKEPIAKEHDDEGKKDETIQKKHSKEKADSKEAKADEKAKIEKENHVQERTKSAPTIDAAYAKSMEFKNKE
jgi:hypothetical protein